MKVILLVFSFGISLFSLAQTALFVPDTLSGSSISLTMHQDSVAFFQGHKSKTFGYNQYPYLGPTLILRKGQSISMSVTNEIGDTTTVHWHGLHVPPSCDGGPHTMIMAGETWNPQFTVMDQASTFWYHPHLHGKTALQAIKGAAGLIIVKDSNETALHLPSNYGIDDFPVIVQSQQYDHNNQAMPLGMQDSTILINGARANYEGHSVYLNAPAQMVRLRLLNASGERVFNFGFSNNHAFQQIGSDGGLLAQPFDTTRIRLSPGERAEIVLNLTGMEGQDLFLRNIGTELPMGVQGGPTMPMPPGSPPMDSPLNGVDFDFMKIHVVVPTANPVTQIPLQLNPITPLSPSAAIVSREIRFTADSMMVMDGPFYFNDSSFNMERIDFVIPVNQIETWKLVNETMVGHPFHIHDVQFYLFDRNNEFPPLNERGRKDVVYVPMGDSVRFVTQFSDFTDTIIPYMFHCHILMHEDAGMMGQFLVVPANYVGLQELKKIERMKVYPNPVVNQLSFDFDDLNSPIDIRVLDQNGCVVLTKSLNSVESLDVSSLSKGFYTVLVRSNQRYFLSKFVKE